MLFVDYFVSGVWKQQGNIDALMLHANSKEGFSHGIKMDRKKVIGLIHGGNVVFALGWNYKNGQWFNIAPLEVMEDKLYCKFTEAGINLENLLNLDFIGQDGRSFIKPLPKNGKQPG